MSDYKQDEKARREEFTRRLYEARKLMDTLPDWKRSSLGPSPLGAPSQAVRPGDPNKPR